MSEKGKFLTRHRKALLKEMIAQRQNELSQVKGRPCSLFIRHLDCGSCNACELELIALSNPIYDIGRWGIRFEASPRHADILVLTGPYVRSLDRAARYTLEAMPVPRIITIGDCAGKESEFENTYAVLPYPEQIRRAIVTHIPGCPPDPQMIVETLLRVVEGILKDKV